MEGCARRTARGPLPRPRSRCPRLRTAASRSGDGRGGRCRRVSTRGGERAMTDLLDELRAANPVDAEQLEVPSRLTARILDRPPRRRPLWRLTAAAALAATCAGVIFAVVGRDHSPDLAARA